MRVNKPHKFNMPFFTLRNNRHLSQEKMANILDVSRSMILDIEKGEAYGKVDFWINVQNEFGISDEDMWKLVLGKSDGQ
jgi:DNA-binding XRE family transcriptional regulator